MTTPVPSPTSERARLIAEAAAAFQRRVTGHAPEALTIVLGPEAVVIALRGALTPGERVLAQDPAGAARVQEYHRQLFAQAAESLRQEIRRIVGADVRDAAAEVESVAGAVIHAFAAGTVVQVFLLEPPADGSAGAVTGGTEVWSGKPPPFLH